MDVATRQQELKDLEFTFIELPKFNKSADEVETLLDKWIYFIKYADDLEVEPEHVTEPALRQAYESANQFGWSEKDLDAYDYQWMRIQDQRGIVEYAKLKGEAIGREEGRQEGVTDMARKMLDGGYALSEISTLTGISISELKELQ